MLKRKATKVDDSNRTKHNYSEQLSNKPVNKMHGSPRYDNSGSKDVHKMPINGNFITKVAAD